MVEQFDSWILALGQLGFLVLGLAALLEYVSPPFPGDTILLLGGVYAVRGQNSPVLVFLAVTVGSVLGSAINYGVGRLVADRIDRQPEGRLFLGLSHARIIDIQQKMRHRGPVVILLNRFLPTFRAVLFVAAGAARMPFARVMALGAASAMAWNLLLLAVGYAVGGNAERLESILRSYQVVVAVLVGGVVLVLLARFFYKSRQRPAEDEGAP
jgi:membrane protein DedA with SNARE-associated domain